jgi:hypothetical protein
MRGTTFYINSLLIETERVKTRFSKDDLIVTIAYRPPPLSTMNRNETIALRFRRKGTVDWVQETVDKPSAAALYPSTRPLTMVTHLDFYFYYCRCCCCRHHYILLYDIQIQLSNVFRTLVQISRS